MAVTRGLALLLLACLGLAGCEDPRDCALTVSHRDCGADALAFARAPDFPQDDTICQGYGLTPGTRDYAVCRRKKREVRQMTERETDYGFLQNPLTPDVRVVPVDPRTAGRE